MANKQSNGLNRTVSQVLALGIYATIFFYVIGIVLLLIKRNSFSYTQMRSFKNIFDFFNDIFILEPEPFLYIGTLTLIFTPILRVFISIYFFYKNNDKKFFFVTAAVGLILLLSIFMGVFFSLKLV